MRFNKHLLTIISVVAFFVSIAQNKTVLNIQTDTPIADIQPTMWGIFFEDINMGADGGIYAELVKNRSFEFIKPLMGWKLDQQPFKEGAITVLAKQGVNLPNPRYLQVKINNASKGNLSITNEGFRGMGIKKGLAYDFSFLYRSQKNGVKLHIELVNAAKEIIGSTMLIPNETGAEWHKQAIRFNATATALKAQLRIWFEGTGTIDVDMISLFPTDTWKNRPGGMRADMIQLLADMKPGFIRFPGGCIVEGFDLANRYQWKKTIGPIEERELKINRWNIEFAHRPTPDYFQTFGLGFYEYFQLAEDIGAEPLPILSCGMACQFNSAELAPLDQIDPFVQDALDLIEFANGKITSKWGKIRNDMGHPAPFNLKMLGVGNENWGPQYIERLAVFQKAIKEKYSYIKIVNSSGTDPDGARFDSLNLSLRKMNADYIDEHYYRKPEWFLQNANRYDHYPRNGSKIFAGEYAAQSDKTVSVNNKNTWLTALSEAAFMTGLERNAAVVQMASYAPLFAHIDAWQWSPDLIWVNNLQSYGTTDYYVQKLFATNKGNKELSITQNNAVVSGQDSLYAAASIDETTQELIVKLVNVSGVKKSINILLDGLKAFASIGKLLQLQNDNLQQTNSFEQPFLISPKELAIEIGTKNIDCALSPYSFSILRVKILAKKQ
jgi:alpha-L-arabinofuranosidase